MAMTIEQQRAIALARARLRVAQNQPGGSYPESQASIDANAAASAASRKLSGGPGVQQRPSMLDEAEAFGSGIIEGVPIAGGWLNDRRKDVQAGLASMIGGGEYDQLRQTADQRDQYLRDNAGGSRFAGNLTGGIATLAPLGATAVGGRLLGIIGNAGQRIGMGAASSGVLSGADTLARTGDVGQAMNSALLGTFLGGAIPAVGATVRKVLSPTNANPTKAAAAAALRREGVDLTAGQATGSRNLQFREAELGGGAAGDFMERQADQFTAAALRRIGVNAPRATHDVIDTAFTDIGRQFDDLAVRNTITPDARLAQDMRALWQRYEGVTNPSTRAPFVERILRDIYGQGAGRPIAGAWYKSTRSELGRVAKSGNPELAEAARDLMHALDDAMERSIQQANPADLGAWREARRNYSNLLVIQNAATRAGPASADGVITPAALRGAAIQHNKKAFARGQNDFTELADAGVSALTPLPDSGTAGRFSAKLMMPLGAASGAGIGSAFGPLGAVGGALVGAAVPPLLGRAMLSGPGRAFLGNQVFNQPRAMIPLPPAIAALQGTQPGPGGNRPPLRITVNGANPIR